MCVVVVVAKDIFDIKDDNLCMMSALNKCSVLSPSDVCLFMFAVRPGQQGTQYLDKAVDIHLGRYIFV